VERVRDVLIALGIDQPNIRMFPEGTATAEQAAAAVGTSVGRIVKSLVFMAGETPILVLVSGSNRVDTERVGFLVGARIKRANADQVRHATGFAIGGVPPLGHSTRLRTLIDRDLLAYDEVWAAAGTPTAVFAIDPPTLVRITSAEVADIAAPTTAGRQ
jgi:prolyl-tRNA editing enzyme YbaK/EbsC (Cys-tRNA(Pro) deacylase)